MNLKSWTLIGLAALLATGCSDKPEAETARPDRTMKVIVGSSPQLDITTRTATDPDGIHIQWLDSDKITLWAENSRQEKVIDAADFALYHYNADFASARFTGDVPPMADDTYTYYATSPRPVETDPATLTATFPLPDIQDGDTRLEGDVLVAAPVNAGALQEGDNSNRVNFRFSHKIHLLKIRLAGNRLDAPIERLTLTFPVPVTGRLLVDTRDPAAPAQLLPSEEGKVLDLRFTTPKTVGETVYAVIAPTRLTAADRIGIKAYSHDAASQTVSFPAKEFLEGHTTPIALTVPVAQPMTSLRFALDDDGLQRIGERVTSFTLIAPEGVLLPNGTRQQRFDCQSDSECELRYDAEAHADLSGQRLEVLFETESTLTRGEVTLPRITPQEVNAVTLNVPYLFYEDFSALNTFDYHTNAPAADAMNYAPIALDQYGLNGWTGTRVGGEQTHGLRIYCRVNFAFNKSFHYDGRVDSAPVSGIKEGKRVTLEVSFDFAGDSELSGKNRTGSPLLTIGSTETQGPIAIEEAAQNIVLDKKPLTAEGDDNGTPLYGKLQNTMSLHLPNAGSKSRITFHITHNVRGGAFAGYSNFWIYLDNVKVKIVK